MTSSEPPSRSDPAHRSDSTSRSDTLSASQMRQDLERWLVDTNDARRRIGQSFYYYYRTLTFWHRRGLPFARITTLWASSASDLLSEMGRTLARMPVQGTDAPMRVYAAEVLERLAEDLRRGDVALPLFLSYMETRFPLLTALMREVDPEQPIHDAALIETLATGLGRAARSAPDSSCEILLQTARDLREAAAPRTPPAPGN